MARAGASDRRIQKAAAHAEQFRALAAAAEAAEATRLAALDVPYASSDELTPASAPPAPKTPLSKSKQKRPAKNAARAAARVSKEASYLDTSDWSHEPKVEERIGNFPGYVQRLFREHGHLEGLCGREMVYRVWCEREELKRAFRDNKYWDAREILEGVWEAETGGRVEEVVEWGW